MRMRVHVDDLPAHRVDQHIVYGKQACDIRMFGLPSLKTASAAALSGEFAP